MLSSATMISAQSDNDFIMDSNDKYTAHLHQKFKEKTKISQNLLAFSPASTDLDLFKSQFLRDLTNNPIHIPYESEDAKSLKKSVINIKDERVETKQLLHDCELADDKLEFKLTKTASEECKEPDEKSIHFIAMDDLTVVKSLRTELVLVKRPHEDIHHRPRSSMSDTTDSSMSFNNESYANEDMGSSNRSTENDDDSLGSEQDMSGGDDSSDDEGNESGDDDNGNASSELVISPTNPQESNSFEHIMLSPEQRNYLDHFEHAHVCPKRIQQELQCTLPICEDPQGLVDYCNNQILGNVPYDDDPVYEKLSQVLVFHSMNCTKEGCNMLLCQHFDGVRMELSAATHRSDALDNYQVKLSNIYEITGEMTEGIDFSLTFLDIRGQGAFGEVFNACFDSVHTLRSHVAVKKIRKGPKLPEMMVEHSLLCLKQLGSHPNLLLPDVVLTCSTHYLYVMQCADISLLDYTMKCFEQFQEDETIIRILQFCCFYFYQMAKGIQYCHQRGFVHGDIKPHNAVLSNNFRELKLIDWDFLREEQRQMKGGTHGYEAPEVLCKRDGGTSLDVYSLCRSLYPLLYSNENDLRLETMQPNLGPKVSDRHQDLGKIFEQGTLIDPVQRITINEIVGEFDANEELATLRSDYRPIQIRHNLGENDDYSKCFNFYRKWMLKKMAQVIEPVFEGRMESD